MSKDKILPDIEPSATMTKAEAEAWAALPAAEQLERLRRAIDKGVASGFSERTMDDIWAEASRRNPDADLETIERGRRGRERDCGL